jgi:DNA-binding NtrC family response regulator
MEQFSIFIVEDDPWYGQVLEYHLSLNPDHQVSRFTTGKDCISNLSKKPDLISIDYSLPDINGMELLNTIKAYDNDIPVIVISGQEDISTALTLIKKGASDYFIKDDSTKDLLWNAVNHAKERKSLKKEVETLKEELGHKYDFGNAIIGKSPPMSKIFSMLEKAVHTNINVYVTGETGTGKEVVAKSIHYNSDRKKKPFVAVNMAAIPRELIESELFGYEKGAFTGAQGRKTGKFEEADKGTLFLDEIAELDMSLQSKILRVLQERELTRVGGHESVKLDVRLIVATHKNLPDEVKAGRFREDLFYRIMGLPIALPPLRDRGNDVLLLARHFLDDFCKANKLKPINIAQDAKEKLMKYHYPGNVRELKSVIDLAAVMCSDNQMTETDIYFTNLTSDSSFLNTEKTLKEYTTDIIAQFLKKYNNNVVTVAKKLGIGKSTIYNMLQEKEITIS